MENNTLSTAQAPAPEPQSQQICESQGKSRLNKNNIFLVCVLNLSLKSHQTMLIASEVKAQSANIAFLQKY